MVVLAVALEPVASGLQKALLPQVPLAVPKLDDGHVRVPIIVVGKSGRCGASARAARAEETRQRGEAPANKHCDCNFIEGRW